MKFTVQREQLLQSVQDVMKAISPRTAIPILTGMKIEAKDSGITLTGSDSDISIESFIPKEDKEHVYIENIQPGGIVLQARYFSEIVRKLPESTIEIEANDQLQVTIRSGKAEFNLNGQDVAEYPHLPQIKSDQSFEMPIDLLKSVIKQTVFAVSTMETRPILTGVNLRLEDKKLHFTATDSHRLAAREVPAEGSEIEFHSVVIPGKSLNELSKILDDTEEEIDINVTENQILFRTQNLNFLSRLLDGNYPETSRLIPEESKTILHLNTRDLLHTIDRASLLAKEDRNNVVQLTTLDEKFVEITSNSPEVGHVSEQLNVQSIEGEDLKISFSAKYMMDALKAIESDEVKIEFTGAMRPFILRPANDDPIIQLILPVRTY